jgi:hypothetical protein
MKVGCSILYILVLKKGGYAMSKSGGHGGHSQSRNDQRSNIHNPNNAANKAAADNHSNQMNPNNPVHTNSQQNKGK